MKDFFLSISLIRFQGSSWAKGHYTDGAEIIEKVMDTFRSEVERCDGFQGVQMFHSICGATGGGLGTLMLTKIREEFPGVFLVLFFLSCC